MRDFIIIALAIYRGVTLINKDEGPYEIFLKFRRWAGVEQVQFTAKNEHGIEEILEIREVPTTEFAKLIHCPYCLSIWVGTAFFLTYRFFKTFYLLLGILGLVDLFITFTNDRR